MLFHSPLLEAVLYHIPFLIPLLLFLLKPSTLYPPPFILPGLCYHLPFMPQQWSYFKFLASQYTSSYMDKIKESL